MRHRRLGLLARILLAAAGAALLSSLSAMGSVRAEPGDGITATGASVDRVGWWHEKNVGTETPAGLVTVPPPPGVPTGTLAVGALNGEPDRITAIGILPEAVPGDTVTRFTLAIKEAEPPAANAGADAGAIVACPITAFWVAASNGTWATHPEFDCDLAKAPGTRAEDGTWTFDLLAIGQAWTDPAGTLTADGIVLVEDVESPAAFQTVFATEGEGALVVTLESTAGTPTTEPPVVDPGVGDPGSFDSGGFEAPAFGSSEVPVGGLPAPAPAPTPSTEAAAPPAAGTPVAAVGPNVLGNLPGGLVVAVPAFLVLLGLMSYSLGPAGEPTASTRQGGVSRALARPSRPSSPVTGPED